ncbi:MAG TPA: glutamate ABC transporter substrate-binding protein [Pseudonocardiaceae bacterium]
MRWNAVLRVGAALAGLAMAVAGCGQQQPPGTDGSTPPVAQGAHFEPGTTMAKIANAHAIRIGTKFDQPLFGQQALGGKLTGFDTEIGRTIAGALGISPDQVQWVEAPSAQREELIKQGKVDLVVATYTINDKRRQQVSFAGPYYIAGQSLMVSSDNNTITGPDSLRPTKARVCSVQGSTPAENIRKYIDPAQLTVFDVYSKCADALRTGQVDVVTTDNVVLLGFVANSNGGFKLVGDTFTREPYGIGIHKGDVAFCTFINNALTQAAKSGVYANAWKKTAGKVTTQMPELPALDSCS